MSAATFRWCSTNVPISIYFILFFVNAVLANVSLINLNCFSSFVRFFCCCRLFGWHCLHHHIASTSSSKWYGNGRGNRKIGHIDLKWHFGWRCYFSVMGIQTICFRARTGRWCYILMYVSTTYIQIHSLAHSICLFHSPLLLGRLVPFFHSTFSRSVVRHFWHPATVENVISIVKS